MFKLIKIRTISKSKMSLKQRIKDKTNNSFQPTVYNQDHSKESQIDQLYNNKNAFTKKSNPYSENKPNPSKSNLCICCKGDFANCTESSICMGLGKCHCKMHEEMNGGDQGDDYDDYDEQQGGFGLNNFIASSQYGNL